MKFIILNLFLKALISSNEEVFDEIEQEDIIPDPQFQNYTISNPQLDIIFLPEASRSNVNKNEKLIPNSFILSSSMDSTVIMQDTIGNIIHTQKEQTAINSIDIQGFQFVTGSADHQVRLQNVLWSEHVGVFIGNQDSILQVKISVDGSQIISGSRDGKIFIWSIFTGKVEKMLIAHLGPVLSLDVSLNFIISGSNDGFLKIQSLKEHKEKWKINTLEHTITAISISSCDNYIIFGGSEGRVQLTDVGSLSLLREFQDHSAPVIFVKLIFDNDLLYIKSIITASSDGLILIYDFKQNQIQKRYNIGQILTSVKNSTCGKQLLIGTKQKVVILFNLLTNQQFVYEKHEGAVSEVVGYTKQHRY